MGSQNTKNQKSDNTKLQRMYPQPNYQIKTRTPTASSDWRTNINRGIRQDELKGQSFILARRKCYDPAMQFLQCEQREGMFWMVFNCQEDYFYLSRCLEHEFKVEMDKRRRDIVRNHEPWWVELYDENGEIGEQAKFVEAEPPAYKRLWDRYFAD